MSAAVLVESPQLVPERLASPFLAADTFLETSVLVLATAVVEDLAPEPPSFADVPTMPEPKKQAKKFKTVKGVDTSDNEVDLQSELLKKNKHRVEKGVLEWTDEQIAQNALTAGKSTRDVPCTQCTRCEMQVETAHLTSHMSCHSTEILDNFLYLGGERNAHNRKELMERTRVTHVVNMACEVANFFSKEIKYASYPIADHSETNITLVFETATAFIENARVTGGRVLVHCVQGISRSATVVMAYLMKYHKFSLEKAHKLVISRRHIINPNPGFWKQLQEYERALFGAEAPAVPYAQPQLTSKALADRDNGKIANSTTNGSSSKSSSCTEPSSKSASKANTNGTNTNSITDKAEAQEEKKDQSLQAAAPTATDTPASTAATSTNIGVSPILGSATQPPTVIATLVHTSAP
jgi:hypothetical protein